MKFETTLGTGASPIRRFLKKYQNRDETTKRACYPHKFRHGHALYALKRSRTISDFKAVSMHLGHASLSVTDQEYGILSDEDVHARISRFSENGGGDVDEERLLEVLREVLRRVG